jgi:outer membrane protein assembly factor BamB
MPFVRFILVAFLAQTAAGEWPQFRGPNGTGVAPATRLPAQFGPARNVVWRTDLPPGHSSPVVAGERIFVTGAEGGTAAEAGRSKIVDEGGRLFTICLAADTGKELWRQEAPRPRRERYQPTNSPASPSPVTDGSSVFVFFGDFGLISYTRDGAERWRLPLGPFNNVNGHGSSPVLVDGRLVLLCDQDTGSYMVAVDAATGAVRWKVDRPEVTRGYATPAVVRRPDGGAELIVPGAHQLAAYDPATGRKLWWVLGMSWQPKSSPVIDGTMLYAHWWEAGGESEQVPEVPAWEEMRARFDANHDGALSWVELAGDARLQKAFPSLDLAGDGILDERDWSVHRARRTSRNALIAVRAGGRGDVTDTAVVWRLQKFLPNVPSPLLYRGVLYIVKDGGIATALDPATGTILKQARLEGAVDTYYASPVAGAGRVYFISRNGKASVLEGGADWRLVASNDLEDECYATPAIAGDRLYVRTRSALYCFRDP